MTGADLLVRNIGLLATMAGPSPRRGAEMADAAYIPRAAVAAARGRIVYAGPEEGLDRAVLPGAGPVTIDAGGGAVVPGLVDAHTHLAFAGDRDEEIRLRLAGASYREIAAEGGGIVRTVTARRAAAAPAGSQAQRIRTKAPAASSQPALRSITTREPREARTRLAKPSGDLKYNASSRSAARNDL